MNYLATLVFHVEVRDLERRDRLKRQDECFVDVPAAAFASQVPSYVSQRTEDLRTIKALTLTMVAETHL